MGTHMKTTVEISDALLEAAKRKAVAEGTTLRAVIEEGLRGVLSEAPGSGPFLLHDESVGGNGLHADVRDGSWKRILELVYEGRGG